MKRRAKPNEPSVLLRHNNTGDGDRSDSYSNRGWGIVAGINVKYGGPFDLNEIIECMASCGLSLFHFADWLTLLWWLAAACLGDIIEWLWGDWATVYGRYGWRSLPLLLWNDSRLAICIYIAEEVQIHLMGIISNWIYENWFVSWMKFRTEDFFKFGFSLGVFMTSAVKLGRLIDF